MDHPAILTVIKHESITEDGAKRVTTYITPSREILKIIGCSDKYIDSIFPVQYKKTIIIKPDDVVKPEPTPPKRGRKSQPVVFSPDLPDAPINGYLRLKQIVGDKKANPPIQPIIPISAPGWWKGVREGRFPKPVKLSERVTAWRASDVQELIKNPAKKWRVR